ncbi:DUF4280 domain-containing protein [Ideonella sp. 4Y16]|uniref:DUF4280 domain-containing protein n=1 Tax=Ideonella alba TaxID=2824118 RepID=A0A941BEV6_9BURK|nr:DUF4280 domain-containing protein [Ideonella alba]MBQ0930392.1 DUF4280 domain-containing protein [Ideonella alba]MBQ0946253.1 DUF4280 domain-containing protein [Ideonella alba]
MPQQVTTSAMMTCPFGLAPSTFNATPRMVMSSNLVCGVITDNVPFMNIPPFGMCTSLSNPTVASATSAALGVLTPMPCVPVFPAPWTPGVPTVLLGNIPAIDNTCTLNCMWGGVITFSTPGQFTHDIP